MNVRYRVDLSQIERTALRALLSGGKHASRKLGAADVQRSSENALRRVDVKLVRSRV